MIRVLFPALLCALTIGSGAAYADAAIPACAGNVEAANIQAVRVEKNGAVIFDDGRAIHPEGIILPAGAADHAPDALMSEALGEMTNLVHSKLVTITANPPKEDRYGRIRAQIFLVDNKTDPWLQVALLKRGLARVSIAPDRRECASELLAAEAPARAAKLGLWAYPVVSVNMYGGRAYLNFGDDWNSALTATISPDDMENFRQASVDPRGYQGKNVRVRGWVEGHNTPQIAVAVPESIEIIPDVPLKPAMQ
jgi:micrococcal nuclease